MTTKRDLIESLRDKIRERDADSNYSNGFLYQSILEQAHWLIRREVTARRIWINTTIFQSLNIKMEEVPLIDSCLPIQTNCKIFRSTDKIPEVWDDTGGPIIKSLSSADGSTEYFYTNSTVWASKRKDPYRSKSTQKYFFYENGYLWIPESNPHFALVHAYFKEDVALFKQDCVDCNKKDCVRFMDTPSYIPQWLEAELLSKAVDLIFGGKRVPDDEQIDKNTNNKD